MPATRWSPRSGRFRGGGCCQAWEVARLRLCVLAEIEVTWSPKFLEEITVRCLPKVGGDRAGANRTKARSGTFQRLASLEDTNPTPTANQTCASRHQTAYTKSGAGVHHGIITSSVEGLERRIKAQPFDLISRHRVCDEQYRCCCGQTEHRKPTPVRHRRRARGDRASSRHPRCTVAWLNRRIRASRHARNDVDSTANLIDAWRGSSVECSNFRFAKYQERLDFSTKPLTDSFDLTENSKIRRTSVTVRA